MIRQSGGVLAVVLAGLSAAADSSDITVDFLSLRGNLYQSGIDLFARALETSPHTSGVRAWSVPSTGYDVSRSELQVLYFKPDLEVRAREIAAVIGEFSSNPVCIRQEIEWRKEGLGDVNIYLPSNLNLDELAGGPVAETRSAIGRCREERTVEDNWLDRQTNVLTEPGSMSAPDTHGGETSSETKDF